MSYTIPSTCIRHNSMPIQIYNQCVACEVQMYKDDADKYKKALKDIMDNFDNDIYSHEIVADVVREALI